MPLPARHSVVAGIRFDPIGSTPGYISMNQHRGGARRVRNRWSVPPTAEYLVFQTSHSAHWTCPNGHLWGIQAGLKQIGLNEECVAKFPRPSNATDDRHGYPVSAQDHKRHWEHRPPPALTSEWKSSGLISDFQKKRIDNGKV